MKNGAGNVHSANRVLHSTFEEAHQAVHQAESDMRIVEISGDGT